MTGLEVGGCQNRKTPNCGFSRDRANPVEFFPAELASKVAGERSSRGMRFDLGKWRRRRWLEEEVPIGFLNRVAYGLTGCQREFWGIFRNFYK